MSKPISVELDQLQIDTVVIMLDDHESGLRMQAVEAYAEGNIQESKRLTEEADTYREMRRIFCAAWAAGGAE